LCIPRVLSIPTVSMRESSSCVVSVDLFRVNDACLHMDIGRDTKTKIKNRKKLMSNRDESTDRWYPTKIYKPKPRKEKPKPEPRPSSLFRRDEGEPQKTKQRWPTHYRKKAVNRKRGCTNVSNVRDDADRSNRFAR